MDFDLSIEQKIIVENVRKFLEKEIAPIVEEYEKNHTPVSKELMKKLIPFGYIGGLLPEEIGGGGLDHVTYFLMIEELSRVWPSLRALTSGANQAVTRIYQHGTKEQKDKYINSLMNGEKTAFFALTEPNVGSDTSSLETTAKLVDGKWVLNGTKMWITNGLDGDIGIVFAQTDKSLGKKGIAAFIVEKGVHHFTTKKIEKMGMDCLPTAEVIFEDCEIPRENILGEVGGGLRLGLSSLNRARVMVAFICSGVAHASLDAAIKYAQERHQFGKPIGSFQLIQGKIADMTVKLNAMRLLALNAAIKLDKKEDCRMEASMAKLYATESALQIADEAIQIHGGYGYSKEFKVERFYRDIRHFTFAEGTSEIHRLLIGRKMLGISALK